jgi:hypothetical protein
MKKQKTELLDKFTDDEIKSLVIKIINSTPLAGVFSTSQKRRLARIVVNMVRKYGLDADLDKVKGEVQFGEMIILDIILPKIFKTIKEEKNEANKERRRDDSENRRRRRKESNPDTKATIGRN